MDNNEKVSIINIQQLKKLKKKDYWCALIHGKVLSNDKMPILFHKNIDKEKGMQYVLESAKYKKGEIAFRRADKVLGILAKDNIRYSNVIIQGEIKYEVY